LDNTTVKRRRVKMKTRICILKILIMISIAFGLVLSKPLFAEVGFSDSKNTERVMEAYKLDESGKTIKYIITKRVLPNGEKMLILTVEDEEGKRISQEEVKEFLNGLFKEKRVISPKEAVSILRKVDVIQRTLRKVKDPDIIALITLEMEKFAAETLVDAAIDKITENIKDETQKVIAKSVLLTLKNMVTLDVKGEVIDMSFLLKDTWEETAEWIKNNLPPIEELPPESRDYFKDLYEAKKYLESESLWDKPKAFFILLKSGFETAFVEPIKRFFKETFLTGGNLSTVPYIGDSIQEDIKRERLVLNLQKMEEFQMPKEEKLETISGYLASLPEAKWIYFGAGSGSPIEMKREGSIVDFTFHIPNYVNVKSTQFTLTADLSSALKDELSSKYFKFFEMKFRNPNDKIIFNFNTLGTYSSDKEDFFGFNFYYDTAFDFDLDYSSNEPRLQGYYGYKTPVGNLPSEGVYIYGFYYWGSDIKLVHPKGYTYEIGGEGGYGVVDWKKHKVYLVAERGHYPSGLALFIGDQIGNQIKGKFMVKSLTSADIHPWYEEKSITIPKFILSETKDNFVQFLGKDEPLVLAWTFNAQWVDNRGDSVSSPGILMGNLIKKTSFTENIVKDNEIWKGFAVGYIRDLTNSNVIFAKNTELENIKFTFKPSTSQFKGEISVFDEFNNKYTLTIDYSDSVYIHHTSFGAIKEVNNSPAFIASYSSDEYSYLSWGHWSVDINDATSQKSVYWFSPWIVGRLTPDNEIPKTGRATYSGYVWGNLIERDSSNNIIYFGGVEGKSELVVDFGKRTLEGKFYNMKKYGSESWKDIQVTASWGDKNKITGRTFTSDGLSGSINGAFFGPTAKEIGGNWDLKGTENGKTVQAAGIFTGKR
jgi:hypothetical protein